jgi:hypothetical protein
MALELAMANMHTEETRFGLGENGHVELTARGLSDALLALFDKVVRGLEEERIRAMVEDVVDEARGQGDPEKVKNLFALAFHTRWCRGGKGERKAFYQILVVLFERYPGVVADLLDLVPSFGYWKDPLSLLRECKMGHVDYAPLRRKVWAMFARQLQSDKDELDAATREGRAPRNLSLAAKFAPSEGSHFSKLLGADKEICKLLFPVLVGAHVTDAAWPAARAKYRRLLTSLRRALAVPEVHMCAQRWAEINFAQVPSLCLDRHKRAFLNEGKGRNSEDEDRTACRERLLEMIAEKGAAALKGKQLFPHEIVAQVLGKRELSTGVSAVLNAQWEAIRTGLLEMVAQRKAELAAAATQVEAVDALQAATELRAGASAGGAPDSAFAEVLSVATDVAIDAAVSSDARKPVGLARVVCMADVSGSMSGTPMNVAIALGILVSEVSHPAFRDKVLTFESEPRWHDLSAETTLVGKVQSLGRAPWGGSTDFGKAMAQIAEMVERERLEQQDIPDLLVVSDMQFDEARDGVGGWGGAYGGHATAPDSWDTAYEKIARKFHDVGMLVHGRPLNPPNIIFWNVRADTLGYPAAADQKGVMLLSGYSPALMKFILSGEMEEEHITLDEEGNAVKTRTQVDPRETLHRVLHDSGLDPVWAVLNEHPPASFL